MAKSNEEIYDAVVKIDMKIEKHLSEQGVKNKIAAFVLSSCFGGMVTILVKVFSTKV